MALHSVECNLFEQCMPSEFSLRLLVVKPESDWVGVVCARNQLHLNSEHGIRYEDRELVLNGAYTSRRVGDTASGTSPLPTSQQTIAF